MSLAQIAASDALVFGTALGWLLIIIFMVTMQRKLSRLRADFKLLSDEVSHLKIAEERRFMSEINAQQKRARVAAVAPASSQNNDGMRRASRAGILMTSPRRDNS
jgi:hypothetical protein